MVQQKSILYIDDQVNQLSFKALFRRKFPIFTTEGLVEAKLILSQHPVGMVLFNQHLPYIATFEFLQWLRNYDEQIIRIFVYSNGYSAEFRDHYPGLIHQYLWKPWKTEEMESVLLQCYSFKNNP